MKTYQLIKRKRESLKLSQECVAYALGISQSQYSRRESGKLKFSLDEIMQVATVLNVPITELVKSNPSNSKNYDHMAGQKIGLTNHLIAQYEARLKEKEEIISLLKEKVSSLEYKD